MKSYGLTKYFMVLNTLVLCCTRGSLATFESVIEKLKRFHSVQCCLLILFSTQQEVRQTWEAVGEILKHDHQSENR